ncbi:MAG: sigma-54 dependent transcriptional regulator, partial [Granulosicoccus sp.]|nr:sigma-54 dependent transcriptional regulator [Granulosicoccus sp.]
MRNFLKKTLASRCALLEVAQSAEDAEALRLRYHFDLLLVDIRLPGLSGLEWLSRLRERGVRTHVIYMTAYADLEMAIGALRNGADDFIMKPFRTEQIFISMRRTLMRAQILRENSLLRLQLNQVRKDGGIVGESEVMQKMLGILHQVAPTTSPVLISGETGSGKSLVASTIHKMSHRSGAFVTIDCSNYDEHTAGIDLFSNDGMLVHADKGTLFLDEVGELPESIQGQLIYVLEHQQLPTLSDQASRAIDIRLLAASSRDLRRDVEQGRLRAELYYRLNVVPVYVPPLKDRGNDLSLLVETFMQELAAELRVAPVPLLHADWQQLSDYPWPGNVRELRNVIERTLLLGQLPSDSFIQTSEESWSGPGFPLTWNLEAVERNHIEAVLASVNNNKSAAARILGVSRKTLERKQTLWYGAPDES